MKNSIALLVIVLCSVSSFAQWNPIDVYKAREFPCDSGETNLEITFCSGYKNELADSLLNVLYKKIIRAIDKDILSSKKELLELQKKKIKTVEDSASIDMDKTELDHNLRYKSSIVNSQRVWLKLRDANSLVVEINCEGGHACNAIRIQADTEEILERMRKLMEYCFYE